MKQILLAILFVLICASTLHAEGITYEVSFDKSIDKVLELKKPLAVFIYDQQPITNTDTVTGFEDESVIWRYNNTYINFQLSRKDANLFSRLTKKYKITKFPSALFFDNKCKFLFTDTFDIYNAARLLDLGRRALYEQRKEQLQGLDSTYNAGNRTPAFLRVYIAKRKSLNFMDNSDLIEEYVNGLKKKDFEDYYKVLFILQAGPIINGKAYIKAYSHPDIVDKIYKTQSPAELSEMNSLMIGNTINSAIKKKSVEQARVAAFFTKNTYGKNLKWGSLESQKHMMDYYWGIKDTAQFIQESISYIDQSYMISLDSIRAWESMQKINNRNYLSASNPELINDGFLFQTVQSKLGITALFLNNTAWLFYKYKDTKTEYLNKAIIWITRSIELDPCELNYDTYAHLLYRLKFYEEAENMQKKALEFIKPNDPMRKRYEKEYEKIKNRTL